MKKTYIVDTNVLLDSADAIDVLQNGVENIVIIPWIVRKELDLLKKDNKVKHKVYEAILAIEENQEELVFLDHIETSQDILNDEIIIEEILKTNIENPILVSNDRFLRVRAEKKGIKTEPYRSSNPFKAESQKYSGIVKLEANEPLIDNCFFWEEGKLFMNHHKDGKKIIDYEHKVWDVKPRSQYQNAAMELLMDDSINLVTIQSEAGFGKTFISLAAALTKVLEEKKYKKVYVLKPNIEMGESFGFLPGTLDSKMDPYFRNVHDLVLKLHEKRSANRIFKKNNSKDPQQETVDVTEIASINKTKFEYIPLNFLRGVNIEDAFVIIDETQNLDRDQVKTILTRMGQNVKCVCVGDTEQIDVPRLNQDNNGLNWIVKFCKGQPNYAHIVLKGQHSRGPICDLIRKCWK